MTESTSNQNLKQINIGCGTEANQQVHDMYMTVKRLGLGDWFINYKGGPMKFSKFFEIRDGLENNNHRGFSFGRTVKVVRQLFIGEL